MKDELTGRDADDATMSLATPMRPSAEGSEDTLVGRSEAAGHLGVSVSTLRRLERTTLPPIVDGRGVHLHSVKRVLEYKIQHTRPKADPSELDGMIAAAAFEHFDQDLGPADVVKQLKISPSLARVLHREWADLRGTFVVGGLAATKIERLALNADGADVKNGDDLVRLLGELEANTCASCDRRSARFCLRCYVGRPNAAERVVSAATASSQERAAAREQRNIERGAGERVRRNQCRA